jgi:hypothetical protein
MNSFKGRGAAPASGPYFVIERFWIFVAKDGVERHRVDLVVRPLGVNESDEGTGVTQLADRNGACVGFEDHQAAPGESFGDPLIDAQRDHVAQVHGAAVVTQHATFDDDPLVGDVHLVRTPTPRARERHYREGAREDEIDHPLVLVDEVHVLPTEDHQSEQDEADETGPHRTPRHGRHRDDPHLPLAQTHSWCHIIKRKDSLAKNQNIGGESRVNFGVRRCASGARPYRSNHEVL